MGTGDVTSGGTPTPTWYDVLGVSSRATSEEIKAAWRHATDRFEPGSGSGQFRMFSDAADVLLDPNRRRAYDATLDDATLDDATLDGAAPDNASLDDAPLVNTQSAPAPIEISTTDAPADLAAEPPPVAAPPTASGAEEEKSPGAFVSTMGGFSAVTLTVLAVLTVAVLVVVAVLGIKVQQQAAVSSARDEAPAAAERAVKALFSYDYRDLASDRKRAQDYMDPTFAKKYLRNFDALEKQKDGTPGLAVQTKAVVTASVESSGVVDAESDLARVLVFVNVVSRKAGGDPQIFQNRVAMTMRKDGDRWLVSNVNSY